VGLPCVKTREEFSKRSTGVGWDLAPSCSTPTISAPHDKLPSKFYVKVQCRIVYANLQCQMCAFRIQNNEFMFELYHLKILIVVEFICVPLYHLKIRGLTIDTEPREFEKPSKISVSDRPWLQLDQRDHHRPKAGSHPPSLEYQST
jgi:hypothetical protein